MSGATKVAVTKAVVVLVEGPGDGYYVMRCLGQCAGADQDKRKPEDYETPFGGGTTPPGFVIRWNTRTDVQELRLAESAEGDQPVFQSVAVAGGVLHLIVRMGGDGQRSKAKIAEIQMLAFALVDVLSVGSYAIQQIALAFIYDADRPDHYPNAGTDCVHERATTFRNDFKDPSTFLPIGSKPGGPTVQYSLLNENVDGPTHASWVKGTDFPIGLFVFHDPNTLQGTLEDHIEPALRGDAVWKDRLDGAEAYLTSLEAAGDDVKDSPSERAKARLTIAGQFNNAGESLGQLIRRGKPPKGTQPTIPDSVFQTPAAQALATFLTSAPWT